MARIRSVKPEFFTNSTTGRLGAVANLANHAERPSGVIGGWKHGLVWTVTVDPYCKWFCNGYIWTWRVFRLFGFKEPRDASRGTCPRCGYRIRLRRDGTVQAHTLWWTVDGRAAGQCSGSGAMTLEDLKREIHAGRLQDSATKERA